MPLISYGMCIRVRVIISERQRIFMPLRKFLMRKGRGEEFNFQLMYRLSNSFQYIFLINNYFLTIPFLRLAITFSISVGLTPSKRVCAFTSVVSLALLSIESTKLSAPSLLIGFSAMRPGKFNG